MNIIEFFLEEEQKQNKKNQRIYSYLRITPPAEMVVRFLPQKDEPFIFRHKVHYNYKTNKFVMCPENNCTICKFLYEYPDKQSVKPFLPQKRFVTFLYDCNDEKNFKEEGFFKLFRFGNSLKMVIKEYVLDEEYGDISDPENGFNFKLKCVKEGSRYNWAGSRPQTKKSKVSKELLDYYFSNVPPISEIVRNEIEYSVKNNHEQFLESIKSILLLSEKNEEVKESDDEDLDEEIKKFLKENTEEEF